MSKVASKLTELVGNTPLLQLTDYNKEKKIRGNLIAKLEYFNPLSSVKDRIALAMIEDAEKKGLLNKDTVIIEPTSGNTGIGLAFVAAAKGYHIIITMPESMSDERKKLLKALNVELILTPAKDGMKGAIRKAEELSFQIENSFNPQQFANEVNPRIHQDTTAVEIWNDLDGKIAAFVAGVGTGGTITGVSEALKEKNPNIKIFAVEPYDSAALSGGTPGPHKIQGIGANFIPELVKFENIDEIYKVRNEEAIETAQDLARTEGLLVGFSSGAAAFAATQIAKRPEFEGKNIVVLLPDTGERYLSTDLYDRIDKIEF
ncbi:MULTISPECIES: cysteine synthase A [unclassified Clostridium]|uniref:cysteine synthase A n=1 Tax=unclassified Clostridium TaxID=2614128 RepID=UPI000297B4FC|nr:MULTISPECIES: cysteine synthase A [unclassified Clostridium]EKQ53816.1 MAG: cysteine synthase A [Clostridium sp. Maddingley MBC34-26]